MNMVEEVDLAAGMVLGGTYEAAFLGRLGLQGVGYRMVEGALGLDVLCGRVVSLSCFVTWLSEV
jgi:hypothetical protein